MKSSNDTAPEALAKLQYEFAAHIRNPQSTEAPDGIEDRRMAIYRDLFFNNIKSFLSGNFPVLRSLYDDQSWESLCRDFYRDYRCQTPLFPELPREFLKYLQDTRQQSEDDPPFMLELAHYEWVELGLSLDESEPDTIAADIGGDLLNGVPILSPVAWPLSYNYPVHEIREDFQPQEKPGEATHLLVWRRHDFEIRFMQLNTIALLLVEKMKEEPDKTGLELLTDIAGVLNHPKPDVVVDGGTALLNEFRDKEIILGTRP
jgi:hypothetical protein